MAIYSCDAQFGFKKNSGCRNAIHSVRKTVERLTKGNNTVNICSLDLSKAFDKVNHVVCVLGPDLINLVQMFARMMVVSYHGLRSCAI